MSQSSFRYRRCLAATVAALTLAGQLSSFVHFVVVRHMVCPEHGELVELEHTAPAATQANSPDRNVYRTSGDEHPGHGHDHCLMTAQLRQRATLTQGEPVHVAGPELARLAPAPGAPRAAVALLRLAPKHSPPA